MHKSQGETLVEVMVAATVGLVISTGTFLLCGTLQVRVLRSLFTTEAVGLSQGQVQAVLADLNNGAASPLYIALPKDFTLRYLKSSGIPASPWTLSTTTDAQAISLPELASYKLQTTVTYVDDTVDDVNPVDLDPFDAVEIAVRIVPANPGVPDAYSNVQLTTRWYR